MQDLLEEFNKSLSKIFDKVQVSQNFHNSFATFYHKFSKLNKFSEAQDEINTIFRKNAPEIFPICNGALEALNETLPTTQIPKSTPEFKIMEELDKIIYVIHRVFETMLQDRINEIDRKNIYNIINGLLLPSVPNKYKSMGFSILMDYMIRLDNRGSDQAVNQLLFIRNSTKPLL